MGVKLFGPVWFLVFLNVVHLHVRGLEVGNTGDDPLVSDAAVQRVSMRLVVGVLAVSAPVVVEGGAIMQTIHGSVLGAVGDEHDQTEVQTRRVALRNQESVGETEAAHVLFQVEFLPARKGVFCLVNDGLEAGDIGDSDGRVLAAADDAVAARRHCGQMRINGTS